MSEVFPDAILGITAVKHCGAKNTEIIYQYSSVIKQIYSLQVYQ